MTDQDEVQHIIDIYQRSGNLRLVGIDPGETTGFVRVEVRRECELSLCLHAHGQYQGLADLVRVRNILYRRVDLAIVEDYIIYPHMIRQHSGSKVPTLRELGRIELQCHEAELPIVYQLASQAKNQWPRSRVAKHFPQLDIKHSSTRRGNFLNHHTLAAFQHVLTFVENQKLMEFFAVEHAI